MFFLDLRNGEVPVQIKISSQDVTGPLIIVKRIPLSQHAHRAGLEHVKNSIDLLFFVFDKDFPSYFINASD